MSLPILSSKIAFEQDVVHARQRARQIAEVLDFSNVEQTRIATAVSEIARNAYEYAKEGKIEFAIEEQPQPALLIRITDKGKGIGSIQEVMDGRYVSSTGMGRGITGSRQLMDEFSIDSSPAGTCVEMKKYLPLEVQNNVKKKVSGITHSLAQNASVSPVSEMHHQNHELMLALQELEKRQEELVRLNEELAETNRGVVALYAELDERAEHLKRADEVKTRFLSHMTHEFRTPVNSTLSLCQFLLDRTDGELTEEQEKQVMLIHKSMESLSILVNDLLDLAKVEAGKVSVYPEECNVEDIFAALRGMFRPLMANPYLKLDFEASQDIPGLYTDEGKVSQVLRNFISNAIKFTKKGTISVTADYNELAKTVKFTVRDTGIGIALQDQQRIFEEFGQIAHALQKEVKGTGLGLPLSKKLAELLGGEIDLESKPGLGSAFSLTIPASYTESANSAISHSPY